MSQGDVSPWGGKPRNISVKHMLTIFAVLGVALAIVYHFAYPADVFLLQNQRSLQTPVSVQTSPANSTTGDVPVVAEPEAAPETSAADLAVDQARASQARERLSQVREQIQQLKVLRTQWQSRAASLQGGDPGRKIAGSPAHLELAVELFDSEPPSATTLTSWEQRLTTLAAPLTDSPHPLELTKEFLAALDDLGREVTESSRRLERQLQLSQALTEETRGLPTADRTLEEALQHRQEKFVREEAERLAVARETARREAEEDRTKRIADLERQLIAAESKREEEKLLAEKQRIEQLTEAEKRQAAEEAKIREAQQRAIEDGLKAEATRVEEAIQAARLERDFQRDLPEIKSCLTAFTSEGFIRRTSGKGPMSLGFLKGKGALEPTNEGMRTLHLLATGTNDRPRGAIPEGINTATFPMLHRASELLRKYGDLMVKKGMLDP